MTAAEIVDTFIRVDMNPVALANELMKDMTVKHGFKYVYTGDDHYLYATRGQVEEMLADLLGIRVEIEREPK
jgi:hypothetical protein